jgi:methylmalonyl-CoA mutase, N-terminal domain
MGGAVAAIERGFQKGEIERSAYAVARETESGERVVVGVNRFVMDEEDPYIPLRVDPAIESRQAAGLARLRAERDGAAVAHRLSELSAAAEGTGDVLRPNVLRPNVLHPNVLHPMKAALRARATVGEVCDALREVWGTYEPADTF